jgi:hypothetical protein
MTAEEEEVLAAARAIIDAANDGNIDRGTSDIVSAFGANGGLLMRPDDSSGGDHQDHSSPPPALHFSHWKHPEVFVQGEMAFMTGYLEGSYEVNGVRSNFSWRDTCIFVKRDEKWVRIHFHTSQLAPDNT